MEIAESRFTEKEVEFIEKVLKKRGLVLDLCCGTARHSILLRKKGWNMVGLDVSPNLLKTAKKKVVEENIHLPLMRGEMRHLPFQAETFDATISMFTSFGYLPSEKEDVKSLKEVARTLKHNGVFLVDVVNREQLLLTFKKKDWGEFPSFYMLEKRTLDIEGSKLHSQWILLDKIDGKTRTFNHDLRLYSLAQLKGMLEAVGLTVEKVFGDYEGHEFTEGSLRSIVLARKAI